MYRMTLPLSNTGDFVILFAYILHASSVMRPMLNGGYEGLNFK